MSAMRLLLIEDNARLGGLVVEGLTQDGFVVDWRETLEGGIEARSLAAYDLVLLDLGLPDGDGLDLVKRLRRNHDAVPILILTARGGLGDRIAGLDVGADDYLVKPFDIAELAARCRALLRRPGACLGVVLRAGNVALDTASRSLEIGGVPVGITPRELALLEHLLRRAGQVVPKPLLEDQLYAMDAEVTPNALEVAVSRLRKRLSAAGADLMLRTAHGVGYALIAEPARAAPHG
ncbi:MAG: response regulator transcription factor [Phenylobacterium sp.]|nr:response regulator transcription factor [Phenylobacterium sp.]MBP7816178.1 response regulator transcription factor [Phenylobacterium sp.]